MTDTAYLDKPCKLLLFPTDELSGVALIQSCNGFILSLLAGIFLATLDKRNRIAPHEARLELRNLVGDVVYASAVDFLASDFRT